MLNWNWTEDREKAHREGRAIKHRDGHLGYIEYNFASAARVVFPDWNGKKRAQEYDRYSPAVTILNTKFEDNFKAKEANMNALYEITKEDGSKVFATKMAEKSKTLWVMEIKGTGEFMAVDTANIQEVVPYTIKVKPVGIGNVCHYEAEENKFSIGDILVLKNGDIVVVVELNTKQKLMSELKAQAKLVTAAL